MFTWLSDELDDEQSAAVLQLGSVFLVACPGSGKTRALTYRIALELSRLQNPVHRIVALTYTNRAAEEIRERIETLGVETSQLWIGTIHSFCLEWIIKPYHVYHNKIRNGYEVIDQQETDDLISSICSQFDGVTPFNCSFHYTSTKIEINCHPSKKAKVVDVIKLYYGELRKLKKIDFEEILYYSYNLISQYEFVSDNIHRLIPFVFVDEFQDTREIQYAIVAKILAKSNGKSGMFIVGDPSQSIYTSLGGKAIGLGELEEMSGIKFTALKLSTNYRSSSRIIDYYSGYDIHNNKVVPSSEIKNYPSLVSYDKVTHKNKMVSELIRLLILNIECKKIAPDEICILAPQWGKLSSVTRALVLRLPQYQFNGPGLLPFAHDMENFWYRLTRLALTEPRPENFRTRLRLVTAIISDLSNHGCQIKDISPRKFLKHSNSLLSDLDHVLDYVENYFNKIFEFLKINISDFDKLVATRSAFVSSAEKRIKKIKNDGFDAIVETTQVRKILRSRQGITLATMHSVKGAEFDVVIAFGFLEGMVPYNDDPDKINSAKKLLYVVSSRARKNLHLIAEIGRTNFKGEPYFPTEALDSRPFNYDGTVFYP